MSKGQQTREAILDSAAVLASQIGLEGLSIGSLATALNMSKSGLFAHFGSKEALQLETLRMAQRRFEENVLHPALMVPRGEPRLRSLFENWIAWLQNNGLPGGCVMLGAVAEYDDRPGTIHDTLAAGFRDLRGAIAKAVRIAIDEDHLRAGTDPWQFAFEMFGIVLATSHDWRLHADPRALQHAQAAFKQLLSRHHPVRTSEP